MQGSGETNSRWFVTEGRNGTDLLMAPVPYDYTFSMEVKEEWLAQIASSSQRTSVDVDADASTAPRNDDSPAAECHEVIEKDIQSITLAQLFETEFGKTFPPGYFANAERAGRLRCIVAGDTAAEKGNLTPTTSIHGGQLTATSLRKGDRVEHVVHRHEPAVPFVPSIEVLTNRAPKAEEETDEKRTEPSRSIAEIESKLLVINKPPFLVIHGTGKFKQNSLCAILNALCPPPFCPADNRPADETEPKGKFPPRKKPPQQKKPRSTAPPLSPCHRLDQGTSGVCIFTRDAQLLSEIGKAINSRQCEKVYLARVDGRFPKVHSDNRNKEYSGISFDEGEVRVSEPIGCVNVRLNIFGVDRLEGKNAVTCFKVLRFDEERQQSIVECRPLTGRQHQIRVHLQLLGHPIVNDQKYNPHPKPPLSVADYAAGTAQARPERTLKLDVERLVATAPDLHDRVDVCPDCAEGGLEVRNESICLHALRYSFSIGGNQLTFQTGLPAWC